MRLKLIKPDLLCFYLLLFYTEALSSDEDEIDDFAPNYLEQVADYSKKKASEAGYEMKAEFKVSGSTFCHFDLCFCYF